MAPPVECPVCGSTEVELTFELRSVPTQDGVLWASAEAARESPLGDIALTLCHRCSYLWNVEYDASKVSFRGYDVSLQHSELYQSFVAELCRRLVDRYELRGKRILEIGCGRGYFLEAICDLAQAEGVGYDPSYQPPEDPSDTHRRLTFVQRVYAETDVRDAADLVVSRHVVDVLPDQPGFVDLIRRTLELDAGRGGVAYLEVPDARYTFGQSIVWNVVYEHHAWFVPDSMSCLLARCGLEVLEIGPCWHDEYLGAEARLATDPTALAPPRGPDENGFRRMVLALASAVDREREAWTERAGELKASGRRAAIWGAGARAIGLLGLIPDLAESVPYAVDVNPARQGLYLPRTAVEVSAPDRLRSEPVDMLIISNPTYAAEIVGQARALGVDADTVVL